MYDKYAIEDCVAIELSRDYVAFVDTCDADLRAFAWSAHISNASLVYAFRYPRINGRRVWTAMHRIILARMLGRELMKGEVVDHIDGDPLNNRRANLRLATPSQNGRNKRPRKTGLGLKGVSLEKGSKKWRAVIVVDGKCIHLGLHESPEAAYAAYCEAAPKYHGEFARLK